MRRRNRMFSTSGKDVELQYSAAEDEIHYSHWWTKRRILQYLHAAPENTCWNCFICILVLTAFQWQVMGLTAHPFMFILDILYNVIYAVHILGIAYNTFVTIENVNIDVRSMFRFALDLGSYFHYVLIIRRRWLTSVCYYLRLHRPFQYLYDYSYNLTGSVLGTTLKYVYIFAVLRVTWAMVWSLVESVPQHQVGNFSDWAVIKVNMDAQSQYLCALYLVDKLFIPIGPSKPPVNDTERLVCLMIMISGCLLVTGAAVASLSLVISLYMQPEEAFRARYKLIMKEMNEINVPLSLRDKVQSFYKMYWHKQRAVSETQLLSTFPPTLPSLIYTDIYFEATQRSRMLCGLSFEFLSEVAKKMTTIHYIPGDPIIKRNSTKSAIIFITYGDVEMITAEDDSTAILRMTRGTILSSCAGGVPAGCGRAHVMIRAATFCTAHVLDAGDLWRVARKYGKTNEQSSLLLDSFYEHFDKVKRYHNIKYPEYAKFKSSILNFRSNLRTLKETKDADGNLILEQPEIFLEIAGSYIMRNRPDSSVDETDAICLKSTYPCILQPDSSLQVAWQIVVSIFALAVAVVYPYFLVFVVNRPPEFAFFDSVANVINIIDIIVHLSTGAHVEEGVPINFSQTSSQQMRSIWFTLDVAAVLPVLTFVGDGHFDGIQKLLKLPKVFRNLYTLENLWVYNSNQMRLISVTLLTLIFCYLIATLQQGFMCLNFGHCVLNNFTHAPQWHKFPLDDNASDGRLTYGLYWAISVVTFTSHKEVFNFESGMWGNVIYTIVLLEICIVMHIFIEAVYSATIMVTTFLRDDYDATISNVKNFMIRNDVDPEMRQRFITYLELCWYTDKAYSMTNRKKSIFHDLPPHVYQEIVSRKRSKYLLNIPFMKLLPKDHLKTISSTARLFYTSPNEILMNSGDITNEIFVIKQGICEVINPDTREVVTWLTARNHFGVLECLLRLPAFYTVRAVTHVQVFSISKKKMGKIMDIPQIRYAVNYARSTPEYRNLQVRRDSFLYFEPLPAAPNRLKFPLPKKYELDTEFLQPFNRLGFLSVLRYVFPRFTIRPDGRYLQRYEWVRACCAMLSAMIFPSYSYLALQWPQLSWITTFLDLTAYYDLIQRLLVGYYNEIGILVYHPAATAAHYLKGAFIVDFLACAPLEFLESTKKEMEQIGSTYIFRRSASRQVLRMNRLIQLYRLPGAINSLADYIERRDIHLVIQAIPFFMALLNVLTCCVVYYSVDILGVKGQGGWHIVPYQDKGGSWLHLFKHVYRFNMTETPWNLHLAAYSWVVYEATTTGYNCFNPTNQGLMMVLFVGMVIGAMIITYYSVCIISVRANVNKELAGFQEDLKDIIDYMHREELDKKLRKEVLDYYEYNWDKMGGVNYNRVLKLCDQLTLRTDAILHIYGPTFGKCPFLVQCDVSLLRIVGRQVRSVYLLRGMHVMELDDVISDMYFLVYGQVQVRVTYEDRSMVHKLHKGSVFGNLDPIATVRSNSTIVALSRIHVLQMNAYTFHRILADFPKVQRQMKKYRGDNENFIAGIQTGHKLAKERTSTAFIFSGRRRLIKHLYIRDQYIQIYLILVSLSCVFADVYNAGFQNNSSELIIALYVLDVGFYLKLVMQCTFPYIVDSDYVKKVLLPMRKSYFKGEFKCDILSCLPIELLAFISYEHFWILFSCLRLNRFLRIITVYKCLKRYHARLNINLTLATVFAVLVWFSLFIHTSSCIWYFIGTIEDKRQPGTSWLHSNVKSNLTALGNGLFRPHGGLATSSNWCDNLYICSVYFMLTTFTQNGVGDIMPKKQSEVLFVCIFQIISTMVYMVYVGEFSNIIQYQSFRNFGYYCKCLELQHFLQNNRVSRNLVNIVNKYSLHLWREARGMQTPHFLASAPPAIKLKVMSAAYMVHIENHILFEDCERAFLRQLVGKLTMFYYTRDMYVVKKGEITDSMYFVHTGRVVETSGKSTSTRVIWPGQSFGQIEGLIPETPFKFSYKTTLKSQILTLSLSDWNYLLKHFPDSANAIYDRLDFDDDSRWPKHNRPLFDYDSYNPFKPRKSKQLRYSQSLPKDVSSGLIAHGHSRDLPGEPLLESSPSDPSDVPRSEGGLKVLSEHVANEPQAGPSGPPHENASIRRSAFLQMAQTDLYGNVSQYNLIRTLDSQSDLELADISGSKENDEETLDLKILISEDVNKETTVSSKERMKRKYSSRVSRLVGPADISSLAGLKYGSSSGEVVQSVASSTSLNESEKLADNFKDISNTSMSLTQIHEKMESIKTFASSTTLINKVKMFIQKKEEEGGTMESNDNDNFYYEQTDEETNPGNRESQIYPPLEYQNSSKQTEIKTTDSGAINEQDGENQIYPSTSAASSQPIVKDAEEVDKIQAKPPDINITEMEDEDDDQASYKELATSNARLSRRSIHVRYEDTAKSEDAGMNLPEPVDKHGSESDDNDNNSNVQSSKKEDENKKDKEKQS